MAILPMREHGQDARGTLQQPSTFAILPQSGNLIQPFGLPFGGWKAPLVTPIGQYQAFCP